MTDNLLELFDKGDTVALGRALKEVENQTELGAKVVCHTVSKGSRAHVVGITGPPGAGKSTVTAKLCKLAANEGANVAVVCIDPTSPFSGGALLGDRIRMQELMRLPNVFIKSLATRGSLGGLAASTADVVQVLDAFGKDFIVIETVGVGQIEIDVLDVSDTVVLVTVPALGDAIQTFKAGIMEIADIFLVNQADRPGAEESARHIKAMVNETVRELWKPPVLQTVAPEAKGIPELLVQIKAHKAYLQNESLWEKNRGLRNSKRFQLRLDQLFRDHVERCIAEHREMDEMVRQVREGKYDPYMAAEVLAKKLFG